MRFKCVNTSAVAGADGPLGVAEAGQHSCGTGPASRERRVIVPVPTAPGPTPTRQETAMRITTPSTAGDEATVARCGRERSRA
ncbi:hypothetical protein Jiend_52120 [Micromonospora endophytica]|nr:hypothetical protein Jiend_52120 [Micromonospora endophytica]